MALCALYSYATKLTAKIGDFGLATGISRTTYGESTTQRAGGGTLAYKAPETFRNEFTTGARDRTASHSHRTLTPLTSHQHHTLTAHSYTSLALPLSLSRAARSLISVVPPASLFAMSSVKTSVVFGAPKCGAIAKLLWNTSARLSSSTIHVVWEHDLALPARSCP